MGRMTGRVAWIYKLIGLATFAFLSLVDHDGYEAWNWIPALTINAALASLWPIYWVVLRWVA